MKIKRIPFQGKHGVVKRVLSFILAFAMVLTMGTFSQLGGGVVAKAGTTNLLKVHFKNEMNWDTVNAKYGSGSSWDAIAGYEDAKNTEFGVAISKDAVNEGWYTYTVKLPEEVTTVNGLFNNGSWGGTNQTSNYSIPVSGDTEVWITYDDVDAGNGITVSTTKPEGWLNILKVHFNNTENWNSVNTKFGSGSSWNPIAGYENAKNQEFGMEINADADNNGWYTYVIGLSDTITEVNGLFNNGAWGGSNQTSNYKISVSGDTEVWITDPDFNNGGDIFVSEEAPEGWIGEVLVAIENGGDDKPESYTGEATITIHYDNAADWDKVYVYLTNGSWGAISGYSYTATWPGAEVEADSANEGWYNFTIKIDAQPINLIFNNANGVQTGNIENLTPMAENTEKWVYFTTNGGVPTLQDAAPAGWVDSTSNPPVNPNAGSTIESPVVNADGTVTFNLDATGTYAGAKTVALMGTLNGTDWNTGLPMSLSADEKTYTVTTPVQTPGVYGYKFKIDGSTWITDPSNEAFTADGNSKVVISGLENKEIDAKRGEATELPTLNYYDAEGNVSVETPVYAVKDTALADVVTIADGKVTVADGSTVDKVVLTATAQGTTSEVTVNVKDFVCTYTVYYYDYNEEHRTPTAADVHVWKVGGGDIGNFAFSEVVTLDDGNEWLKASFTSSATNIGLIPRSAGAWIWQTGNHYFENSAKAENVTVYIVYGDDANTYTSLPEIKEVRDRFAVIEYERSAADYTGWNIYTWNSGFGSAVSKEIINNNGKYDAIIPVYDVSADFTLAFCMRLSEGENEWALKDGGDHYLLIPADQLVVKAKFIQDKGIVEVLPYNTGYEMDAANDRIHFCYRDDELFRNNKEAALDGKVQVVIDGQAYAMAYDAANERYYYDAVGLVTGNHEYYYMVDGEKLLDAFNTKTNADETASVLTYKKFDNLGISATMYYPTMTYNDNNVVTVKLTGDDAAKLTKSEIVSVQVDCSALGTGTLDIEPQLMEGTISCLSTVNAGVKTLPVTVKDIYGNVYYTTVDVTITDRTAATGDFDWDQSVIYFTVTDRFFDGSTANNSGVDKEGSLSYHGGDFAGLQAKLDYLQELGINTIWITPIVANSDTVTDKDGKKIESTGYHGYWASDFTKLNSHLGTEEEFAALIKEVHAHGMKLMVDVVINHAGYNTESYFNNILVDDSTGTSIAMIRDAGNSVTGSDIYGSLAGLPDFVTENEAVRNQLIEWQVDWITKYDIDYFRVDTVKHVDTATWKAFKNALTKQNQDFKLIGEEAGSGYASNSVNLGTGSMDALLDFDTNGWMADYLTGSISSVEALLVNRNNAISNVITLGQFINSHDEDGLQYKLQTDKQLSGQQAADLMKVAATMTLTSKGIPVIYYGEELGLYGEDNYPYQTNRYDMDWALAEVQKADKASIYNHYKTMLGIRNEYSQLFAKGNRITVKASDEEGYDVFSRSYGDTTLYIGTNIKSEAKAVQIPVAGDRNTVYTDLYSGTLYTVNKDGMIDITIPAAKDGGTVVLVKTGELSNKITVSGKDFNDVVSTIKAVQPGETIEIISADTKDIPGSVFEAMKNKDVNVIIHLENGYWLINGKFVTDVKESINFDITLASKAVSDDKVSAIADGNKTLQLSLAHDGELGMTASLNINVGTEYAGKEAKLYYYNERNNELEYSQSKTVDEKGYAGFGFVHASDYVIVFSDTNTEPENPAQEETTKENPTSDGNDNDTAETITSPGTGNVTQIFPVAIVFVLGLAAVACGIYRRKRIL